MSVSDRTQPTTVHAEYYIPQQPSYVWTPDNFPFAVTLLDKKRYTPFMDPTIYQVQMAQNWKISTPNPNGTLTTATGINYTQIEPCTLSSFGANTGVFSSINYQDCYCLSANQPGGTPITLEGSFMSNRFFHIGIWVSKCNNATSNVTCQPQSVIDDKLSGAIFQLYYGNTFINLGDFENTFTKYNNGYFTSVDPSSYKSMTMFLKKLTVSSDIGWIGTNSTVDYKEAVALDSSTENLDYRQSDIFVQMDIRFGNDQESDLRRYNKLPDILSQTVGLYSTILLIFTIITIYYSRLKYYEGLVNDHYSFNISEKKNKKGGFGSNKKQKGSIKEQVMVNLKSEKEGTKNQDHYNYICPEVQIVDAHTQKTEFEEGVMSPSSNENSPIKKRSINYGNFDTLQKTSHCNGDEPITQGPESLLTIDSKVKINVAADEAKKDRLMSYLSTKKSSSKLHFHLLGLFTALFCCKCCKKRQRSQEKFALVKQGMKQLRKEVDVFAILKALRELKQLKALLFDDENQLALFSELPKTVLPNPLKKTAKKPSTKESFRIQYLKSNHQPKLPNLSQAYQVLKNKEEKTVMDERLINIFEELENTENLDDEQE
jgi:hypothetical protein